MKDVKRYDWSSHVGCMIEQPSGGFVEAADYYILLAELQHRQSLPDADQSAILARAESLLNQAIKDAAAWKFLFQTATSDTERAGSSSDKWAVVPRRITPEMEVAFAETWYRKRRCFDDPEMDDAYAALLLAAPTAPASLPCSSRIPASLYRELVSLRELRDQLKAYSERFLRDEMEDRDSCISEDQHTMASDLAKALENAFTKEWKGSDPTDQGKRL